jgi:hypothetical protein
MDGSGTALNGYFFLAGACIFVSGLLCMALGKHSATNEPRARLILRREYGLFYCSLFWKAAVDRYSPFLHRSR